MLIRNMTADDIDEVVKLETACFTHPWTKNMFLGELAQTTTTYMVAEQDGKIVGYMGMYQAADEGNVTNIAVLPEYRRQGIASALLNSFINLCIDKKLCFLTLEVRKSNTGAISLYKKFGFTEVGLRPKYYDNTEDAILMTRYFD
ncbi:MAG: ribosomal protein S18-alanine N-acetyltransferase [Clostridia bacterium]|nr:ribosomal protein S18-alanine N-acetyltransferase [Clostridia bacterium]